MTEYFNENIIGVTELNGYVKEVLEAIPVFRTLRVRGEISNFKHHVQSGHFYFSLKDEGSVIKAVMFARDARRMKFLPESGMKVVVRGRLSVYERDGNYQLYVTEMEADGKGALYEAYEKLKKKLEDEGLFSDRYKKELPKFPKTVGVITSSTGAAVRDIINITGRRYPLAKILVYPALVQGEGAARSLISGVKCFTETVRPDVAIIGRGGGSIEDLWAFNNEALARAIAASNIPFISAVGHETDFTICDFVCSRRAPTPSGAAEIAVPDITELRERLISLNGEISGTVLRKLDGLKEKITEIEKKRVISSPYGFIDERKRDLDTVIDRLESGSRLVISGKREKFMAISGKLNALSPLAVLTRGYGAVYSSDGKRVITGVNDVSVGDSIKLRMSDGEVYASATGINKFKDGNLSKEVKSDGR